MHPASSSDSDLENVIARVRAKLVDGEHRICDREQPFASAFWPTWTHGRLVHPEGHPDDRALRPTLEQAFREELAAIQAVFKEVGDPMPWLTGMSMWDVFAFPLRRVGDQVMCIRSPHELHDILRIGVMDVDDFIRAVSIKTANDAVEISQLKRRHDRLAAIVGAVIVVCVFMALLAFSR